MHTDMHTYLYTWLFFIILIYAYVWAQVYVRDRIVTHPLSAADTLIFFLNEGYDANLEHSC